MPGYDVIAGEYEKALIAVVRRTAMRVRVRAVYAAPVDTGFLRNSCYVATAGSSDYEAVTAKAAARAERPMLPEETEKSRVAAIVAFGAQYALPQEVLRKPFLGPAVSAETQAFRDAVRDVLRRAR